MTFENDLALAKYSYLALAKYKQVFKIASLQENTRLQNKSIPSFLSYSGSSNLC